jgi:hypothetical protein
MNLEQLEILVLDLQQQIVNLTAKVDSIKTVENSLEQLDVNIINQAFDQSLDTSLTYIT